MRRALLVGLTPIVLGFLVAVVWVNVVDPWYWSVRGDRVVMGESEAGGQFAAVAWFAGLGMVVSALWGALLAIVGRSTWLLVPLVVVTTVIAALIAWRVGIWFGPADPQSVQGLAEGDRVPAALVVDTLAAFIAWPAAGLVGVLAAIVLAPDRTPDHAGTHARH